MNKFMIKHFFLIAIIFSNNNNLCTNNETLFKQAEEFYNQGNYQEAIDNYQRYCKPKVNQPILYFNLANAFS